MSEWKKYTGSDEQIKELNSAIGSSCNGVLLKLKDGKQEIITSHLHAYEFSEYLIIQDDPLREMKIRQARTGQPVWIMYMKDLMVLRPGDKAWRKEIIVTTTPDWNIPNAEYSFTPFEEEV